MTTTAMLIAALDTKGAEAAFVAQILRARGVMPLVLDAGVLGTPAFAPDISRDEVALAGGSAIATLTAQHEKSTAMEVMTRGAAEVARRLYAQGRFDGVFGLGGSAGTSIATSAMRALPIGVPKVMVSTVASGDTRPYVGAKDITLMYSVVDVSGINSFSARILSNAAGALVGMLETVAPTIETKPLLAASMFGNTTPCVDHARVLLEAAGYEVLVFHATGAGGQTMESLIEDGFVRGVLDVTTTEWADELCGGVFSAGPHRLEAAAHRGLPQVVAPGCLDMVNFGGPETVPERYRHRRLYRWNPNVTLMRTNPEENAKLGEIVANKVNASTGPAAVLLPLRGVSQLDSPGGEFWWPEADQALYTAISRHLRRGIHLEELDLNINDPAFSERAVALLRAMLDVLPG